MPGDYLSRSRRPEWSRSRAANPIGGRSGSIRGRSPDRSDRQRDIENYRERTPATHPPKEADFICIPASDRKIKPARRDSVELSLHRNPETESAHERLNTVTGESCMLRRANATHHDRPDWDWDAYYRPTNCPPYPDNRPGRERWADGPTFARERASTPERRRYSDYEGVDFTTLSGGFQPGFTSQRSNSRRDSDFGLEDLSLQDRSENPTRRHESRSYRDWSKHGGYR